MGPLSVLETVPASGVMGVPILLVHGINMSRDVWRDVVGILGRRRRVISFDLRGHGQSGKNGPFTAKNYAEDALAVLDALDIPKAHLVGVSFGGSIVTTLSALSPARAVTVAAFGAALNIQAGDMSGAFQLLRTEGVRDFFSSILPEASFAPGTSPEIIDRAIDAASRGRDSETVIAVITSAVSEDVAASVLAVNAPALVVTGELDATCPIESGRHLAEALRTEFVMVPEYGHVLPMEAPEKVASLIEAHATKYSH